MRGGWGVWREREESAIVKEEKERSNLGNIENKEGIKGNKS